MIEQILALLLALGLSASGLTTAAERVGAIPQSSTDAIDGVLADEMAALQAQAGLARAAARGQSEGNGEVRSAEAVDGLTQAADALTDALANAPEQAEPGLKRALEAVTNAPAHDRPAAPATGGAPVEVTVTAPTVAIPPVPTPPAEPGPPVTPPVEVPAGPPSDTPGGRP
jgi:hypothetical protein